MLSVEEALERLLAGCQPVAESEHVATLDAHGRVLARDLVSPIDVPPLDNSQMDGYAVRCADVPAAGTRLPIAQRIAAGQVGTALVPGTAARIFTGARPPAGRRRPGDGCFHRHRPSAGDAARARRHLLDR